MSDGRQTRWDKAVAHASEALDVYKRLGPTGMFAATWIANSLDLYKRGDRSEALLEQLESIKL